MPEVMRPEVFRRQRVTIESQGAAHCHPSRAIEDDGILTRLVASEMAIARECAPWRLGERLNVRLDGRRESGMRHKALFGLAVS